MGFGARFSALEGHRYKLITSRGGPRTSTWEVSGVVGSASRSSFCA